MIDYLRAIRDIAKAASIHFSESDGWAMCSHVAFSLMLSLFPFLIFATSLAGFFGDEARTRSIVDLVFDYWPPQIAEPIVREIETVLSGSNLSFLTFGIGLALFFASNGIEAIRIALNRAYRDRDNRSFIALRLESMFFAAAIACLVVFSSLSLVSMPGAWVSRAIKDVSSGAPFKLVVAISVLALIVAWGHARLPAKRRRFSQVWPGVLLTLVLWIASGGVFAYYVAEIADYSATYAGLAGIMTAQIFLYLMAVVFIFGAEVNAELEIRRG